MRSLFARRQLLRGAVLGCSALSLASCGGQRSTLPPAPAGPSGFVPLTRLARYPEVYAGASLTTTGTVVEAAAGLYTLTAPGVRLRIEIYPADVAARWRGRRVTVSGSLSVTFQTGYELALDAVEAAR